MSQPDRSSFRRLCLPSPDICLLLLALAAGAQAAAPPLRVPDSGSILRETQGVRPEAPPRRESTDITPAAPPPPSSAASGETLKVSGFKLEDFSLIDEAEIQQVLEPYRDRELSLRQLEEAVNQVSELYRQRGYPVARAYLPRQQAADGLITLRLLVGAYGAASLENASLVNDGRIAATLGNNLPQGRPVRRADLERAVLLLGDLPGAGIPKLSMGPGQQAGSTDFFAQVPAGRRASGYLMSDNMGSRYTGRWRFAAGAEVNSPLGIGDKLSFFGLTTKHRDMTNLSVNYAFPLNADGLRLDLGYTHAEYELGGEFRDLDATGKADTVEAGLSYLLIRSAAQNLHLGFSLAQRRLRDDYDALEVKERGRSSLGKLSLRHELWSSLFGRPFYARSGGALTAGRHRAHSSEDGETDFRHTEGGYRYLGLDFLGRLDLTENWSFSLSASGQQAFGKNLDSSEQFSVSGSGGVKIYRETISGDNGYLVNAELRYRLPAAGGLEHSLGVFADHGGWSYEKAPWPQRRSDHLTDVGLGYTANYGPLAVKAQVLHGLGRYPSELKKEKHTDVSLLVILSF
jgi:hemolysin activation/secretion protein